MAVTLRKVSDVPVGVFLQAASTRAPTRGCFPKAKGPPVKTFSIGYEGEYQTYQNELHYARRMAELVGADHHERLLTQDDSSEFLPTDGAPAGRADC